MVYGAWAGRVQRESAVPPSLETSAPALDDPRLADRVSGSPTGDVLGSPETVDGALLVCDQRARNLALIGDPGGAQAVTRTFTVTRSRQQAHLIRLTLHASTPRPTGASMYSTPSSGQTSDESYGVGAHWVRGVITTKISFFITLTTTDLWLTPMVQDIVLIYTIGATKAKTSGNGGATGGNGTASGAGTGAGSGVGGSGNGSGVGAGQGTSADLGGSGTAGTPGSTAKSGANVVVPAGAQVATTGGAAAEGTITGVPLNVGNLSGGALGGGGGSPPPHVEPRRRPARRGRRGVRRLPADLPAVGGAAASAAPHRPRAHGRRGRVDRGGGAPAMVAEVRLPGRSRSPRIVAPIERYRAPGSPVRPHTSFRASAARPTSSAVFR